MRHETVEIVCEIEYNTGTRREVPAETYTILDSSGRPREIDLCEKHRRRFIDTPAHVADQYGRKVRLVNSAPRRRAATG